MYSPLPYLNYLLIQRSPGTDLLGRTEFALPPWFFRSTCTDLALSVYARNMYFRGKIKERETGELELWYERIQSKNDFGTMLRLVLYYSSFPIIIIALLTDSLLIPILLTMSSSEIKGLYMILVFLILASFALANETLNRFLSGNEFFQYIVAALLIAISTSVFLIPSQYLLPDSGLIISLLVFFYLVFLGLNFYTLKRMPEVIEAIFLKALQKL